MFCSFVLSIVDVLTATLAPLSAGSSIPATFPSHEPPPVNRVEVYKVRWWGTEGAEQTRPDFEVACIDNGCLEVRHVVVPGRPLSHYQLPYWTVKSFLSIVNRPAELTHDVAATFLADGKSQTLHFLVKQGFELATFESSDVLRMTSVPGKDPLGLEELVFVDKRSPVVRIGLRGTNRSKASLRDLRLQIVYLQDFNWSDFGQADEHGQYATTPDGEGMASAFFAWSSGMQRGYEFVRGENCSLAYRRDREMNRWRVTVSSHVDELAPGQAFLFSHAVRSLTAMPEPTTNLAFRSLPSSEQLEFHRVVPSTLRTAAIRPEGRVMLPELIAGLDRPKTRGLNWLTNAAMPMDRLESYKQWGCNLIITEPGKPQDVRAIIDRGKALGMEVFVSHGAFWDPPPRTDALYPASSPSSQPCHYADSHGLDEDHYYWFYTEPTRDFTRDFGKEMGRATQAERVTYWARCFREKWTKTLAEIREGSPAANIWFYSPSPGIAYVDPLDYYDVFFREIASLGNVLSVFPFYYGVDYDQAEYMVRRWKDAGVSRVVYLPTWHFLAKPSQLFRQITAARRGEADGACGYSFIAHEDNDQTSWEWRSSLLASQANFPTREMDAYCLIEEPAELIEALATSDVAVRAFGAQDASAFARQLRPLLPGTVRIMTDPAAETRAGELNVLLCDERTRTDTKGSYCLADLNAGDGKGLIQMRPQYVYLSGNDDKGVANAMTLFLRFAELARAERGGRP